MNRIIEIITNYLGEGYDCRKINNLSKEVESFLKEFNLPNDRQTVEYVTDFHLYLMKGE